MYKITVDQGDGLQDYEHDQKFTSYDGAVACLVRILMEVTEPKAKTAFLGYGGPELRVAMGRINWANGEQWKYRIEEAT